MSFSVSPSIGFIIQTHTYGVSTAPTQIASGLFQSSSISVSVYPRWYKQISVEWSVPATWGSCLFNVYFGPTQNGPWQILNPAPIAGPFLTETVSQEYSKFDKGYYVVETILQSQGNVSVKSNPITWTAYQSDWVKLRSTEIQRRYYILLSKFVGVKSYLFRKKTYGARCSNCWDPQTEKVIKDHCHVCYGTSFDGGYFDPVPLYLQYDPSPNNDNRTYFGLIESNQIGAKCISIPEIRLNDIVVRTGDWNLYRVDKMTNTELMTNTVSQIALLTQLAKDDIEYELVTKNLPEFPQTFV